MPTITPIQTQYAGCLFRSRLEARWAVFFDHLGVTWRYEPEGFNLDGQWYLPDFYLPGLDAWYEVKGTKPTEREQHLAAKLAAASCKNVFIAPGDIPFHVDERGLGSLDDYGIEAFPHDSGWDYQYAWCICTHCGAVGIEFEGRSPRIGCHYIDDDKYPRTGDHPRILAAYTAARSARFEHGQSG